MEYPNRAGTGNFTRERRIDAHYGNVSTRSSLMRRFICSKSTANFCKNVKKHTQTQDCVQMQNNAYRALTQKGSLRVLIKYFRRCIFEYIHRAPYEIYDGQKRNGVRLKVILIRGLSRSRYNSIYANSIFARAAIV